MKYVKILGLLAVAAAATMAFAGSASATTVTGPVAGEDTPFIHAVNEAGKHVTLHNAIVNIECQSTVEGKVEKHGSGITASGNISNLTFNNCTNEWVIDVVNKGSLEVHWTGVGNNHGTGTLTSTGATVTATRAGLSCSYQTNNTPIGHILGGNPATLTISASIPRHAGSFLCGGATATWTGAYVTTQTLKIDQ